MKKLFCVLKEKRGSVLIESWATIIIILLFTVSFISAYGVIMKKQKLDMVSNEIRRIVEIDGKYGSEQQRQAEQLLSDNNLDAAVTCSKSGNIALGDTFTITLTSNGSIGFGGSNGISIPLSAKSDGRSEVYWK